MLCGHAGTAPEMHNPTMTPGRPLARKCAKTALGLRIAMNRNMVAAAAPATTKTFERWHPVSVIIATGRTKHWKGRMKHAAWAIEGVLGLQKAAQTRARLPSMSKQESKREGNCPRRCEAGRGMGDCRAPSASDNGDGAAAAAVALVFDRMQRRGSAGW
jgi:hypothetical protein